MEQSTSKLDGLRISRDAEPGGGARRWPWVAGAAIAVVLAAAGTWAFSGSQGPAPQQSASPASAVASPVLASDSLLDASGYVVARRRATVSSKIMGKLVEVPIEEGQYVEAGQILGRLDDTNARAALNQARARLAQSEANLKSAEVTLADLQSAYDRNEDLFEKGIISAQDVESSRSAYNARRMGVLVAQQAVAVEEAALNVARQNLEDTIVRAPYAGVVTVKAAEPGEIVSPSATGGFTRTGICTIVDMNSLEVEVDVSESFIARVRPKLPVEVRLNAYPDWVIPGEVLAVIPTADRARATVKVRIALNIKDPRIVPEMGARVAFLEAKTASAP